MKRSRNNGGLASLLLIKRGYGGLTGADGRVGINLTDGSSFNLSNAARMALDEFVYDPNGTSNSTSFNLTKGTFTFVAGKGAKTGDKQRRYPLYSAGPLLGRAPQPHAD